MQGNYAQYVKQKQYRDIQKEQQREAIGILWNNEIDRLNNIILCFTIGLIYYSSPSFIFPKD